MDMRTGRLADRWIKGFDELVDELIDGVKYLLKTNNIMHLPGFLDFCSTSVICRLFCNNINSYVICVFRTILH